MSHNKSTANCNVEYCCWYKSVNVCDASQTHAHAYKKTNIRGERKVLLRINSQDNEIFQTKKSFKNCTSIKKLQTLINYITDT